MTTVQENAHAPPELLCVREYSVRGLKLPNRFAVAQRVPLYSKHVRDGNLQDEHLVHYTSLAMGGAGLVLVEGVAVSQEGLSGDADLGLFRPTHLAQHRRLCSLIHESTISKVGVQLTHGGALAPLRTSEAGTPTCAGSPTDDADRVVNLIQHLDVPSLVKSFADAACLAVDAGYDCVSIQAGEGGLLEQFCSAVHNMRMDAYGGSEEARCSLLLEIVEQVRAVLPMKMPLMICLPARLCVAPQLKAMGVDLFRTANHPLFYANPVDDHEGSREIDSVGRGEYFIKNRNAELAYVRRVALQDPYWIRNELEAMRIPYWYPYYQTMSYLSIRKQQAIGQTG